MAKAAQSSQEFRLSVDTLGAVIRRWKSIGIGTVLVTVLAGAMSYLLPKTYQATAQLLINLSPYKSSSLEQAPLEVDTYERLLRHPGHVEEVKKRLNLHEMTVESLRNRMRVFVVKRPSVRETTFAPLIELQVTGTEPETCQAIANLWAELATSESLRIKSAVIKRDNERIRSQFNTTSGSLRDKEEALKNFDIAVQLEERIAELEVVRKQLAAEQQNLGTLRLEFGVAQARLDDLKHKYASFFVDGVWVGTLGGGIRGTTASLETAGVDPLAEQFLHARNELLDKSRSLADYKIRERVEVAQQEYEDLTDTIERLSREVNGTRTNLAQEEAKLERLTAEIAGVPQYVLESKAISDEALWSAVADHPKSLDEITSKRLTSEKLNPIWLSLQGRLEYVKPEIAALQARLQSQETLLAQLRSQRAARHDDVVRHTRDVQNLDTELQVAKDRYEVLAKAFLLISEEAMFQEGETTRLRAEITNSEQQVERLTSAAMVLGEYTVTQTLEKERLQRELTSTKNIYTSLATKYEEARITELEVSGDLQIAFPAPLPEDSIGPNRPLIVGTAFLCSVIFFLLLAVVREYVEQQSLAT